MSSIASGTTTTTGLVYTSDTTGNLVLQTNGTTTAVTIDTSQRVGIGTSSPSTFLQIGSTTANSNSVITFGKTTSTLQSTLPTIYCGSVIQSGTSPDLVLQTGSTSGGVVFVTGGSLNNNLIYDSNGNLGLGVTPSAWQSGRKAFQVGNASINSVTPSQNQIGANFYYDGTNNKYISSDYASLYQQLSGTHQWYIAPSGTAGNTITGFSTAAMTLDNSGNLLVGATATSVTTGGFALQPASGGSAINIGHTSGTSSGSSYTQFLYNGSAIGTITQNGTTAVAYNTTSDRRLKTNIADLTNSGTVIDSLKPRSFTWISDNSADAGFIADEIQQVLPKAVTGQPNATKEEEYEVTPAVKDSEGNITTPAVMGTRTVPDYQMIDASQPELIAYLVAEVQSLRARLKAANIA
jgi:hypothetical protein